MLDVASISSWSRSATWLLTRQWGLHCCTHTKRDDDSERPDYVIHSYTKEPSGSWAPQRPLGLWLAEREWPCLFQKEKWSPVTKPNGRWGYHSMERNAVLECVLSISHAALRCRQRLKYSMVWKTYEMQVKTWLIPWLGEDFWCSLPDINVSCPACQIAITMNIVRTTCIWGCQRRQFTIDMEGNGNRAPINRDVNKQFFGTCLSPQSQAQGASRATTVAFVPSTDHAFRTQRWGTQWSRHQKPTTMRISIGLEDPRMFIAHIIEAAKLSIDRKMQQTSHRASLVVTVSMKIYMQTYMDVHWGLLRASPKFSQLYL